MTFRFISLNGVRYLKAKMQQMIVKAVAAVTAESIGAAPMSHRRTDERCGTGTAVAYGHVGLSDAIDDTRGVNDGFAASPLAVKLLGEASASWGGLLIGRDLNMMHRAGFWGVAASCANKPDGIVDGCLAVFDYRGLDNWGAQLFITDASPARMFFRGVGNAASNLWSPWLEVATK